MKLIGGISMVKNSPFKALGKQKQMSMIARVVCNRFKWYIYTTLPNPSKKKNVLATNIQPWKLTWNLNKNHPLEKENHLSNIHFWRSMLIFHGCIAILKNSNCKPSPFKPLKLNCVAGALPRWQINVSLIFQRSCWLVLLHQKVWRCMNNSSNSPLQNAWKNPFKSFEDIGSQQLFVDHLLSSLSSRRCTPRLDRFFQWRCLSWKLVILHPSCPGKFVVHGDFFILQSIFPTKFNSEWKPLESYKRAPRPQEEAGSSSNGELLNFGGVYEQTFSAPASKKYLDDILRWLVCLFECKMRGFCWEKNFGNNM